MKPIPGQIYTFLEITQLDLLDSPSLCFWYDGHKTCVQDAHVTDEQMLVVPGMAATKWRYIRTTEEWIPIFMCESTEALMACVDIVPELNPLYGNAGWWVTPKGHPRLQYDEQPPCPQCGEQLDASHQHSQGA